MKFFNKIFRHPIFFGICLVLLSIIAAMGFRHVAQKTGSELITPLDNVSSLQSDIKATDYSLKKNEFNKIQKINEIILKHKEHHKKTFLTLYEYHFSSISLLIIFSILTGLLAFLIGQKGWKETHQTTRTLFLTCGALASFYALSINVYKQDVGINKNLDSYIQYDNLQKEILNYYSTEPNQKLDGDTLNFSDFHTYTVKRLVEINNIYLEFDKNAVEVKNYLDEM